MKTIIYCTNQQIYHDTRDLLGDAYDVRLLQDDTRPERGSFIRHGNARIGFTDTEVTRHGRLEHVVTLKEARLETNVKTRYDE